MNIYKLSRRAKADLLEIAWATELQWSEAQAEKYLGAVAQCFQMLAENPRMGRQCDSIAQGLRRFEKASHVIFYREVRGGIAVSRILHSKMEPGRQKF